MDIYINKEWPADVLRFLVCSKCRCWQIPKLLLLFFFQIHVVVFFKSILLNWLNLLSGIHLSLRGVTYLGQEMLSTVWHIACRLDGLFFMWVSWMASWPMLAFLVQAVPAVEFLDGGTNTMLGAPTYCVDQLFPKTTWKWKESGPSEGRLHLGIRQWPGQILILIPMSATWVMTWKVWIFSLSCYGDLSHMKCISKESVYIISSTPWTLTQ